jgi:F-type H+-transporting ATPase subunit epsilon
MAGNVMQVELVSPERVLYSGEATMVITRTVGGGDIAFMPGHAPFLAALTENHTRIFLPDGSVQDAAVHGGFVQVAHNKVSILSDIAELGEQIDITRAHRAEEQAETSLAQAHETESEAALRRAHARIAAAGGVGAASSARGTH